MNSKEPESTPIGTPGSGLMVKEVKALNIVWGAFGTGEECTGIVERIDKPEIGGIFTKYIGCNYLFKGYPDMQVIDMIAVPKKIIARGMLLLSQRLFQFVFGFSACVFLLLPKSLKKKFIFSILDYLCIVSHLAVRKFILPPERFCASVKEIGITLTTIILEIKDKWIIYVLGLARDVGCMILEYDYAYKARVQDVLPFLDKDKLKKNPKKEISRIIDILIGREVGRIGYKWESIKMLIGLVLMFKDVRNFVVKFLTALDLNKIKPDEADWYFVLDRNDYNYGGLTHEERMKISAELDKKVGNHRPKIIFKEKTNVV